MNRRAAIALLATQAVLVLKGNITMDVFRELLEWSMKEKKGLTFWMHGQSVGGGVVRLIGNDAVELRSQQYSKIVIRLSAVDAIAAM